MPAVRKPTAPEQGEGVEGLAEDLVLCFRSAGQGGMPLIATQPIRKTVVAVTGMWLAQTPSGACPGRERFVPPPPPWPVDPPSLKQKEHTWP